MSTSNVNEVAKHSNKSRILYFRFLKLFDQKLFIIFFSFSCCLQLYFGTLYLIIFSFWVAWGLGWDGGERLPEILALFPSNRCIRWKRAKANTKGTNFLKQLFHLWWFNWVMFGDSPPTNASLQSLDIIWKRI